MDVADILTAIGERYGLIPVYALVIAAAALMAHSLRHLATALVILTGVYAVMFKAFDLKRDLDVFHLTERFKIHPDVANGVAAALFVFVLGFAIYGLKRLFVRRSA